MGNSHLSRLRAGSQRTLAGAGSEDEGWEMGEAHRRGRAAGKCPNRKKWITLYPVLLARMGRFSVQSALNYDWVMT